VFTPDDTVFGKYNYIPEYIELMLRKLCILNTGLSINLQWYADFFLRNGLLDLSTENLNQDPIYPPIHIKEIMILRLQLRMARSIVRSISLSLMVKTQPREEHIYRPLEKHMLKQFVIFTAKIMTQLT
jgi:DNA gyrase/topoisomerase IV subunit B